MGRLINPSFRKPRKYTHKLLTFVVNQQSFSWFLAFPFYEMDRKMVPFQLIKDSIRRMCDCEKHTN